MPNKIFVIFLSPFYCLISRLSIFYEPAILRFFFFRLTVKYKDLREKEMFFFTPRERKHQNGTRLNRVTGSGPDSGSGYWKSTGADKRIKFKGALVGFKKQLVYYRKNPEAGGEGEKNDWIKTDWIMHEFRVPNNPTPRKKDGTNMEVLTCHISFSLHFSF